MKDLRDGCLCFLEEEGGVTAVEYGLIAALIAVVSIIATALVGTSLDQLFRNIAACLGDTTGGGTCPGIGD